MLVEGEISRSFKETSTCKSRECRNRFTGPPFVSASKVVPFALVIFAFTNSCFFAKSRYSSPVPETLNSMGPVSVMLLRGRYSIHCPLVIDVCVAGIVKRSSSDFVHSWDSRWTKTVLLKEGKFVFEFLLLWKCFPSLAWRWTLFFLIVLSFLHLFYQHLTAENPGKGGPELFLSCFVNASLTFSPAHTYCVTSRPFWGAFLSST